MGEPGEGPGDKLGLMEGVGYMKAGKIKGGQARLEMSIIYTNE